MEDLENKQKMFDYPRDLRQAVETGIGSGSVDDVLRNIQAYLTMAFVNQCTKSGSDPKIEAALKETFKVIMRKRSI